MQTPLSKVSSHILTANSTVASESHLFLISTQHLILVPSASFPKFSLPLAFLALVRLVSALSRALLLLRSLIGRFILFSFFLSLFCLMASAPFTLYVLCSWFFLLSQP